MNLIQPRHIWLILALFGSYAAIVLLPIPLPFESLTQYLPIHMLLEAFSIVVAMLIFGVVWNSYSSERSGNAVILACVMLAVGLLDLGHTLSFKGMPEFVTPSGVEKAIWFWLAARFLAALALVVVAIRPWTRPPSLVIKYLSLAGCLAITAAVYWAVLLHLDALPRTFIEGRGLTSTKIGAEYAIIAILTVPAILFYLSLRRGSSPDKEALLTATVVSILSEICFTLYNDAADRFNFLGHVYKAVAFCYIYRAMFVSSVREPFQRLLRMTAELRDSEARFSTVFHSSPIGIGLGTLDGRMLVANQAWLDLLGYQLDEVIGRTTEELGIYQRPEDRLEVIATLKASGRISNLEPCLSG